MALDIHQVIIKKVYCVFILYISDEFLCHHKVDYIYMNRSIYLAVETAAAIQLRSATNGGLVIVR